MNMKFISLIRQDFLFFYLRLISVKLHMFLPLLQISKGNAILKSLTLLGYIVNRWEPKLIRSIYETYLYDKKSWKVQKLHGENNRFLRYSYIVRGYILVIQCSFSLSIKIYYEWSCMLRVFSKYNTVSKMKRIL